MLDVSGNSIDSVTLPSGAGSQIAWSPSESTKIFILQGSQNILYVTFTTTTLGAPTSCLNAGSPVANIAFNSSGNVFSSSTVTCHVNNNILFTCVATTTGAMHLTSGSNVLIYDQPPVCTSGQFSRQVIPGQQLEGLAIDSQNDMIVASFDYDYNARVVVSQGFAGPFVYDNSSGACFLHAPYVLPVCSVVH